MDLGLQGRHALHELAHQVLMGVYVFCHHQQPTGVFVQTVYDPGAGNLCQGGLESRRCPGRRA